MLHISDVSAGGNSRQHNGNHYGDTNNHYTNVYPPLLRLADDNIEQRETRNIALIRAAGEGQTRRVEKLLRDGADVDYQNNYGTTALHEAAFSGFEDTVRALLHAGADVNAFDEVWGVPLGLAAMKARANVVRILLASRAGVDRPAGALGTPLHAACFSDDSAVVAIMLQALNPSRITQQLARVADSVVKYLDAAGSFGNTTGITGAGSQIETPADIRRSARAQSRRTFYSPLQVTARYNRTRVIEPLLEAGAADKLISSRGRAANNPVHKAARLNHAEWLETFLRLQPQYHSFIGLDWSEGRLSSLSVAVYRHSFDCLECLLRRNASNIDAQSTDKENRSETALFAASFESNPRCLDLLIAYGANVDLPNEALGLTPIMEAARRGHVACVRSLIKAGASLSAPAVSANPYRYNALHLAAQHDHVESIKVLLEAGMDIDGTDSYGDTALMHAIYTNSCEAMGALLHAGASVSPRNSVGQTAVDIIDLVCGEEIHARFTLEQDRIMAEATTKP
ncbi:uncharacterized protein LTR77_011039 [Saxophila tyrrhenica]|uniref:Uncharacterized protein n=1 Tax=Saxophila tyrrhenica TaxID=1690608 RepID=A0AAV9NTP8_9PEZI|nr:hypothetical protein LTR77_011039 [Saxophila tyrrhenica]